MRRLIPVLSGLVFLLSLTPQVASAAPRVPNYRPAEIGDRIRTQEATRSAIDEGEAAGEGAGDQGEAGIASVGDQKLFLVLDDTTGQYALTTFTLRGVGTHGEVWVQNNLNFPSGDPRSAVVVTDEQVEYLIDEFDSNIYPKESEMWRTPESHDGEDSLLVEWGYVPEGYYVPSDGVERVVILVANVRDENFYDSDYPVYIAGYYTSAFEQYFDRNVMTIDAYDWGNRVGPDDAPWRPDDGTANDRPHLYEGTFAHEYQHLLHDDLDSDEENWINEGMSDFAETVTGYSDLNDNGHIDAFLEHPYNSLVAWGDQGDLEILADYGAAYLMQLYLHQQYGREFIQQLAYNQENGIAGVEAVLEETGEDESFAEIYRDWVTALLINGKAAGGRYEFDGLEKRIELDEEGETGDEVLAWGPSFYQIDASPKIRGISIEGISFLPSPWSVVEDPLNEGNQVLYSGGGDLTSNVMILPLDLTDESGATLRLKTLYDIESHWDFAMVQVSTDQGQTWESLGNESTTDEHDANAHPEIIANLPGLTGYSDGWVELSYDLSDYDGEEILLSFRYMTDWGSQGNGELEAPGWYIDDVEVGDFTSEGDSMEPFNSIDEVLERYAEYSITFAGRMKNGKAGWQVLHLDPQTFDEDTQEDLEEFLHNASLSEVIMIVSLAAPDGSNDGAPFDFTVERKPDGPKPPKNKKK